MSRLSRLKLLPLLALALLPAGCNRPGITGPIQLPTTQIDPSTLVATISHGDTVDLDEHLVPGTWTLLEFGADW
jgi:hypothetical protein